MGASGRSKGQQDTLEKKKWLENQKEEKAPRYIMGDREI